MIKEVSTEKAPAAIGPYSQAKTAGDFIFVSGQIPVNPENGNVSGTDIKIQAEQSIKNIIEILNAAGTTIESVVKTTCFITDMEKFKDFNEVYGRYFTSKPARSCVEVSSLPKGVMCEIEVIAFRE